jgi:hypothetical protein
MFHLICLGTHGIELPGFLQLPHSPFIYDKISQRSRVFGVLREGAAWQVDVVGGA